MNLILINNSSDAVSYVSGDIEIAADSQLDVDSDYWFQLYQDTTFISDVRSSNILINDGTDTLNYPQSEEYLEKLIIASIGNREPSGVSKVGQAGAQVTQDITTTGEVELDVTGLGTVLVNITSDDWSLGSLRFDYSIDGGTTWIPSAGTDLILLDGAPYYQVSVDTFTLNNGAVFQFDVSGTNRFRVKTADNIVGTVTIQIGSSVGSFLHPAFYSYLYTNSNIRDGIGQAITSTPVDASQALDVNIVNAIEVDPPVGGATEAKQDAGNASLTSIDSKITAVNTGAVVVSSSALPSGASTAAKQDTGNTSLSSIDGKITAVNTGAVVISSSALPTGAATSAKQDDQITALQIIDDWDESDRAKINPIVGQAGVQGGSGAVSNTTQRVVLATDVGLPAGTNAIGKLAANDGVDIGNVDVASLPANATVDINRIVGSAPSVSNPLPVRLTNGTNFYDAIPTMYNYAIASQVHVNSSNTVHWDLFNADASVIIRVMSIKQIPNITTAVTGVVFDWQLMRTTSVGTGGSAQTAWLSDLSGTALDADVTCRSKPGGGAAASTVLNNYSLSSEETNTATIQIASQGGLELVPEPLRPAYGGRGIVLRQNQGIRCVQVNASVQGNTGWLITFIQE